MKLDTSQTIAGYPILRIRDLFKWRSELCCENLEDKLKLSAAKATKLLKELMQLGYLEVLAVHSPEEHRK